MVSWCAGALASRRAGMAAMFAIDVRLLSCSESGQSWKKGIRLLPYASAI